MFKITIIAALDTGNILRRSGEVESHMQVLSLYDTLAMSMSREMHEMGVRLAPRTLPRIELERTISTSYENPTAFAEAFDKLSSVN